MIIPSSANMNNLSAHEAPKNHNAINRSTTSTSSSTAKSSAATESTSQLPEPVSDHLFLNNIRPEQAREFLLNHINRKLDISSPATIRGAVDYQTDINADSEISNQIIASINKVLSSSNVESSANATTINTVTEDINTGFTEVKDILKNLNILRREFLTEFNSTQENVNKFLDNISSNTAAQTLDPVE